MNSEISGIPSFMDHLQISFTIINEIINSFFHNLFVIKTQIMQIRSIFVMIQIIVIIFVIEQSVMSLSFKWLELFILSSHSFHQHFLLKYITASLYPTLSFFFFRRGQFGGNANSVCKYPANVKLQSCKKKDGKCHGQMRPSFAAPLASQEYKSFSGSPIPISPTNHLQIHYMRNHSIGYKLAPTLKPTLNHQSLPFSLITKPVTVELSRFL